MKNPILFFAILLFASCQSQYAPNEGITVKLASSAMPIGANDSQTFKDGWYSELSEISGFENYEEENGILLGKKLSIGTYVNLENRKEKLLILEEIRHQKNGEALFRKLDSTFITLKKNQFIATDFCNSDNVNGQIIAIYEGINDTEPSKKIIKAWLINQQTLQIEKISTKGIVCELVN